jgi:hypothetical protein
MNQWIKARAVRGFIGSALLGSLLSIGATMGVMAAPTCTNTGALDRDGTPLTARIVNPAASVHGRVDATGCSVGVYFGHGNGRVDGADISGATYYGVLVDGNVNDVRVEVRGSSVHDIGDTPMTASRHGEGIAYRSFDGGSARGTVQGNRVWHFQEAGINETGPGSTVTVDDNRVTGRGAQGVISQNGIQVIFGAHGTVRGNEISDLRFTGPNVGIGVIVVGGPSYAKPYTRDTLVERNEITGADAGVLVFELDLDYLPPAQPTNVVIRNNVIVNRELTNHEGWDGASVGYQVGILLDGYRDQAIGNTIVGRGYNQAYCGAAAVCLPIDTDAELDPILRGNHIR